MKDIKIYMHVYVSRNTRSRFRKCAVFLKIKQHELLDLALDALESKNPQLLQYFKEEKMKEDDTT